MKPMEINIGEDKGNDKIKNNRRYYKVCFCCSIETCYTIDELPNGWSTKPLTVDGYRVNRGWWGSLASILDPNHNEFWMIWSDLLPFIIYLVLLTVFLTNNTAYNIERLQYSNNKMLELQVFIGIILCRGLSLFFHIFNCVNLWTSQRLIFVDLIGVACMCFVSPYFYYLGGTENFNIYCYILFTMMTVSIIIFSYIMYVGESPMASKMRQPLLCALAAAGNWPALRIVINPLLENKLRLYTGLSLGCLLGGYVLCYINFLPEVFMTRGAADGKFWNSHVIWHILLFVSQILYLSVILIPDVCYK